MTNGAPKHRPEWLGAVEELGKAFASTDATPGGGSAAGLAGVVAAGLARMAVGISAASKKADEARRRALKSDGEHFRKDQDAFQELTAEDAVAFDGFMEAYGLPKDDPARPGAMAEALKAAAEVPLATAERAAAVLGRVRDAKGRAVGTVASDLNCAEHLLRAAGLCALENVEINCESMKDEALAARLRESAAKLRASLS